MLFLNKKKNAKKEKWVGLFWEFFLLFRIEIVKLVTVMQTEGQNEFYTLLGSFMYVALHDSLKKEKIQGFFKKTNIYNKTQKFRKNPSLFSFFNELLDIGNSWSNDIIILESTYLFYLKSK